MAYDGRPPVAIPDEIKKLVIERGTRVAKSPLRVGRGPNRAGDGEGKGGDRGVGEKCM